MLINCKECNSQISEKAMSCPNCGNILKTPPKNVGCFMQTMNFGCMSILIVILGYFVFMVGYIIYKRYIMN